MFYTAISVYLTLTAPQCTKHLHHAIRFKDKMLLTLILKFYWKKRGNYIDS